MGCVFSGAVHGSHSHSHSHWPTPLWPVVFLVFGLFGMQTNLRLRCSVLSPQDTRQRHSPTSLGPGEGRRTSYAHSPLVQTHAYEHHHQVPKKNYRALYPAVLSTPSDQITTNQIINNRSQSPISPIPIPLAIPILLGLDSEARGLYITGTKGAAYSEEASRKGRGR